MQEEFAIEAELSPDFIQQRIGATNYPVLTFRYRIVKRVADCFLVGISFIPCLLIGVLLALLIHVSSRGPVFYREHRIGRHGKEFQILKFRSMYTGKEQRRRLQQTEHTGLELRCTHKGLDDPRITPIGQFLRKWSLDELPQLLNVLRGDMSLIGPRPIVEAERKFYGKDFSFYCLVRPGISGLWQVSGRSNVGYKDRVALDFRYVSDWSLGLDMTILLKTFHVVITAHGAY
jgi:exopolysaccharide production protein ExoY